MIIQLRILKESVQGDRPPKEEEANYTFMEGEKEQSYNSASLPLSTLTNTTTSSTGICYIYINRSSHYSIKMLLKR